MTTSYYLGAYWAARRENLEACSQRLGRWLADLSELDRAWSTWYRKAERKRVAGKSPIDPDALGEILEAGRNRRDTDNAVIAELGFSADAWNGDWKRPTSFSVTCGASSTWVGNHVVLELPATVEIATEDWCNEEKANRLMRATVTYWDPDWAVISSNELRRVQQRAPGEPFVGWITYLSRSLAQRSSSASARVQATDNGGVIISVPGDCEKLDFETARKVQKELEALSSRRQ